uniref:Uncharacterized protein LOC104250114 isoform X1 n=1 Tax=Nicotiana sylvestris TaxID=4096 RepID=A0A1U7YLM6_NICSY|nr:PREDICTED: uncharacterized protein LOC104250114 isoform X1 [Nicotiana sylvestris]
MPIDIKATTQSCLFQKRKRHYSAERASKLKLRRHDVYANQSADKKEMLLAQRRSKNIESTSQGLLFEHIEVASSSETAAELPRQRILTIGESCCLDEKADKSCADDTTVCSNKGKNIIGSVSVFEYGSTSNPLDERRDPEVSVVIKRGCRSKIIGCWNFKQLPSNATILKTVPNCKYCGAKRFDYESAEFCCSNGSVKLTSYEMPYELLNLYLGNTEECEHFRTYIRLYNNMFAFTSLGVNYDKVIAKRNHEMYTFRVQGLYHFINDLIPTNRQPRNLQLYFYDENIEILNRMASSDILRQSIIEKLMDILKINPYGIFLKSLIHIPELSNFYAALRCGSSLD